MADFARRSHHLHSHSHKLICYHIRMIDRFLCGRTRDDFSSEYSSNEAVLGTRLVNPDMPDLAVVFPPWHGGGMVTKALVGRLSRENAVLETRLHNRILEPDINRVINSFQSTKERIVSQIEELQDEIGYDTVHLVGLSLGNVALALAAKEYQDFHRATMVVAGSNLATSVWDGVGAIQVRREFEKQGVSRTELDEAWKGLAPISYASAFADKYVKTHI